MDIERIKATYPVQEKIMEAIRLTQEAKEYLSQMLSEEEKRLRDTDLWAQRSSLPYNRLEMAYWSMVDAINDEINYAAETLKNDVLDEMVNKLT